MSRCQLEKEEEEKQRHREQHAQRLVGRRGQDKDQDLQCLGDVARESGLNLEGNRKPESFKAGYDVIRSVLRGSQSCGGKIWREGSEWIWRDQRWWRKYSINILKLFSKSVPCLPSPLPLPWFRCLLLCHTVPTSA